MNSASQELAHQARWYKLTAKGAIYAAKSSAAKNTDCPQSTDTDGDGICDNFDLDMDGDGIHNAAGREGSEFHRFKFVNTPDDGDGSNDFTPTLGNPSYFSNSTDLNTNGSTLTLIASSSSNFILSGLIPFSKH